MMFAHSNEQVLSLRRGGTLLLGNQVPTCFCNWLGNEDDEGNEYQALGWGSGLIDGYQGGIIAVEGVYTCFTLRLTVFSFLLPGMLLDCSTFRNITSRHTLFSPFTSFYKHHAKEVKIGGQWWGRCRTGPRFNSRDDQNVTLTASMTSSRLAQNLSVHQPFMTTLYSPSLTFDVSCQGG